MTYTLSSPFIELEWNSRPNYWIPLVIVWFVLWSVFIVTLGYLYVVEFHSMVGFESALLTGIFLLIMAEP